MRTMLLRSSFIAAGLLLLPLAATVAEAAPAAKKKQSCASYPPPVVALQFGSRYKDDSKTRSDIDSSSNNEVNKALQPVDRFIQVLAKQTGKIEAGDDKDGFVSNCVLDALDQWASADALSDMKTLNTKLAIPARIAGIAIAFSELDPNKIDPAKRQRIEGWLKMRVEEIIAFFDGDAPKNAGRNNLRAWAALAVAQVGVAQHDQHFVDWALATNKTMLGGSGADGSLPLEMGRAKYALHYQVHAVAPLVTSTALLCQGGYGTDEATLKELHKVVDFTLTALDDPTIVEKITSHPQTVDEGLAANKERIAWVEPYLSMIDDKPLATKTAALRPFLNSKLGGNVTEIYKGKSISCSSPRG